ncbi:MAG: hypothetical protein QXH91_05745 [Candidatus Bathyarchaeia archaeon]
MTRVPYNKGDAYENNIFRILKAKGLLVAGAKRAGAGGGADVVFLHKGKSYKLEIKLDKGVDYGQKMLVWSAKDGWRWSEDDDVTRLYTELGVLKFLKKKGVVPIKFSKPNTNITQADKEADQKNFEDRLPNIPMEALFKYYEGKGCFYIQIGKGFGFYHLSKDVAKLGTQQFNAILRLRFRAKTIHSRPVWNYGFYAVLKIVSIGTKSKFNIEPAKGQVFPPIDARQNSGKHICTRFSRLLQRRRA